MPDRLYHARNHPPSRGDRLAAHWLEITIALMGILRGGLSIVADYVEFITPPVDRVPEVYGLAVSVSLIVGGVVWIRSVIRRFDTLNRFYLNLRTGLGLVTLGWIAHLIAAIVFNPTHVFIWSATLSITLSTSGLYFQTFVNEKTIRGEEVLSHE